MNRYVYMRVLAMKLRWQLRRLKRSIRFRTLARYAQTTFLLQPGRSYLIIINNSDNDTKYRITDLSLRFHTTKRSNDDRRCQAFQQTMFNWNRLRKNNKLNTIITTSMRNANSTTTIFKNKLTEFRNFYFYFYFFFFLPSWISNRCRRIVQHHQYWKQTLS